MYILKALTAACENFVKESVQNDMRDGGSIVVEFNRILEAIAALRATGFEPGRNFSLIP